MHFYYLVIKLQTEKIKKHHYFLFEILYLSSKNVSLEISKHTLGRVCK